MTITTLKLIDKLNSEGREDLAQAVFDLSMSVSRWEKNVDKLVGMYKVCPTCKKEIYGNEEIEFLTHVGECSTCDHVRGDLNA